MRTRNSPNWKRRWTGVLALAASCGAIGCEVRTTASHLPAPRMTPVAARTTESLQAEADDPKAAPPPGKQPASPGGTPKKPGQGTVTQGTPAKPAAPLLGPAGNSLATGAKTLPEVFVKDKVELRDADGTKVFSFKPKGEAVKFYDAGGEELCKLSLSTDKLKAKSADDRPLFELKHKEDKSALRIPPDDREAWKFKPRGDRLEIHTGDDRLAYVVRRDKGAVVLERPDGKLVCRAERQGGSTVVNDASGKRLITSTAVTDPLALVFFGWSELSPIEQAACLVFYLRKNPS